MTPPLAPRVAGRRDRPVAWIPPQHGAWAFLGLPVAVALTVSPWSPVILLLAATWVAAYPASYLTLAVARDRASRNPRPARFARPLATWWLIVLAAGLPLLALRPWLAWVAALYTAAFVVNLAYARRRDERSLVNDAVFIVECTVMVPVTWMVAVGGQTAAPPPLSDIPAQVWVLTAAVALLLVGSTLHVKSLIRERADARYSRVSRGTAVVSVGASVGLAVWWGLPSGLLLVAPFGWFAIRSFTTSASMRPARIGMVELVGFLLLVAAAALAGR